MSALFMARFWFLSFMETRCHMESQRPCNFLDSWLCTLLTLRDVCSWYWYNCDFNEVVFLYSVNDVEDILLHTHHEDPSWWTWCHVNSRWTLGYQLTRWFCWFKVCGEGAQHSITHLKTYQSTNRSSKWWTEGSIPWRDLAWGQICVGIDGLDISCSDKWMSPNRKFALMPFST